MDTNKIEQWLEEYKHYQGKHNQKLHGNRGGRVTADGRMIGKFVAGKGKDLQSDFAAIAKTVKPGLEKDQKITEIEKIAREIYKTGKYQGKSATGINDNNGEADMGRLLEVSRFYAYNQPKASGGTKVSQAARSSTNHYGEDVKLPKPPKTGEIRPRYQEVLTGLTKAAGAKRHAADQASIDKSIKSTIARIKGSSNVYQGLKPDAKDIKILKDWMKMKIDLQTTFDAMNASDGWAK